MPQIYDNPGDTRFKTSAPKADHHHKNICVFSLVPLIKHHVKCIKLGHFRVPLHILKFVIN